jgi:hypothetical protein
VRSIRQRCAGRRLAVVTVAVATVLTGCTGGTDDPRSAVRSAAAELRDQEGTELRVRATDGLTAPGGGLDPDLIALADDAVLVLRSSRERAVHARLDLGDDPETSAASEALGRRLSEVGLEPVGSTLGSGDWLRVTNQPDGDAPDRLGDALGGSLDRLAESAEDATEVGGDGAADRLVRLTAERDLVDDLVQQVVRAADTDGPPAPTGDGDDGTTATVDVHLADGRVTEVVVPVVVAGVDVPVTIEVAEPDDPDDLPTDAQPFGLRALIRDLALTAPADTDPDTDTDPGADAPDGGDAPGPDDDPTPSIEDPDREPTPFREDGVLDEAFEGQDPFGETDFECVTDDDLDTLEATLGADARAEVEELITSGHLERC